MWIFTVESARRVTMTLGASVVVSGKVTEPRWSPYSPSGALRVHHGTDLAQPQFYCSCDGTGKCKCKCRSTVFCSRFYPCYSKNCEIRTQNRMNRLWILKSAACSYFRVDATRCGCYLHKSTAILSCVDPPRQVSWIFYCGHIYPK